MLHFTSLEFRIFLTGALDPFTLIGHQEMEDANGVHVNGEALYDLPRNDVKWGYTYYTC